MTIRRLAFRALLAAVLPLATACASSSRGGTSGDGGAGGLVPMHDDGGGGAPSASAYCAPCSSDADCGGGANFCLAFSFGNYCGTDCGSGQACPTGARCVAIGDGTGRTVGMSCVPATGQTCSTGGGTGADAGGGSMDAGVCTTDTFSGWPSTFFADHCAHCHGTEFASAYSDRSRAGTISAYISSGRMPPRETLSGADRSRILDWLSCGAP